MHTKTPVHLRKIVRKSKGKTRQEWHLRWHGTDGKHYCKKLADCGRMTKREAEAKRREFQVGMDRDEIPRDKPEAMTLTEFAEYHNEMIGRDRRPTTLYEYKLSARLAEEILGSKKAIQSITSADVGKLRNKLSGGPATRAKHISRLRAMFNKAKRWGLIHGDNPFANQPMPRFTSRPMRIFSPEEIEAMLEASPTLWWRALILVGVTAGPRRAEIINLMWRNLDAGARTISITAKQPEAFRGSDGTEYETLEWAPKTYTTRTIPIPDRTVSVLQELREQSDGSPYLFISLERLELINRKMREGQRRETAEICNNLGRDFKVVQKRAAEILGAEDWTFGTLHDLRRTYGTLLADEVPMHVLQAWMGHSDISVTATFYLGQGEHHADRAREAFWPSTASWSSRPCSVASAEA